MAELFTPHSSFMRAVQVRGFLHQCTHWQELDVALLHAERSGEPLIAYIGFDCTAESLHVGSLMQIMMLRHLQQAGHKPIVLMGGGTTRVGDPTGKDKSRQILDDATIDRNKAGIKKVFTQFIHFGEGKTDALMVDNAEWLLGLNYITFLREVGRHFSVNQMLAKESVRQRLERESHLSFLEFNYMILQAYDFCELYKHYGCRLQIGGSDQWGNITEGVDLFRRLNAESGEQAPPLFGLTTPLLTTASGAKMGKTADGAIWLNPDMLSAYDYWQFWRNADDADVGRFLRLFTELPLDEIIRLEALRDAEINEAKKVLATEATAMLHGREAAEQAELTARQLFEQGMADEHVPSVTLSQSQLGAATLPAFKLFHLAGLADSASEARRLIKGGGAKINDEKIVSETQEIPLPVHQDENLKLSAGKKKHILVKICS